MCNEKNYITPKNKRHRINSLGGINIQSLNVNGIE